MNIAQAFPNAPSPKYLTRFVAKISATDEQGCWIWTASKDRQGFGLFTLGSGPMKRAHRVAATWSARKVPAGHDVRQVCTNEACVNPAHLEAVERRLTAAWRNAPPRAGHGNFHRYDNGLVRLQSAIVEAVHDVGQLSKAELQMRFARTPDWYVRDTIQALIASERLTFDGQFLTLPGPVERSSSMSSSN